MHEPSVGTGRGFFAEVVAHRDQFGAALGLKFLEAKHIKDMQALLRLV